MSAFTNIVDFWGDVAYRGYIPSTTTPLSASGNIDDFWKKVAESGLLPVSTTPFATTPNVADFWKKVAVAGALPITSTVFKSISNTDDFWQEVARIGAFPTRGNLHPCNNIGDFWKIIAENGSGAILGAELVTSGNMELDNPPTATWIPATDGTFLTVSDERTGGRGTRSLDILIADAQTSVSAVEVVTLEVGKTYTFSGWAKLISGTKLDFIIYSNNYGVDFLGFALINLTPSEWTRYSMNFVCTEAGAIPGMIAHGVAGDHARFDDVSIRESF